MRSIQRLFKKILPVFLGFLLLANSSMPGFFVLADVIEETVQEVEVLEEEEVVLETEEVAVEEAEEEEIVEVVETIEVEEVEEEVEIVEVEEEVAIEEEEEVETLETWVVEGNRATTTLPVTLGTTYFAPQDSNVSVTFTKLPDVSSTLSIEKIFLTDEEIEKVNAVSNVAFDITTDMVNGTFEYDLTLPFVDGDIKVGFVEERDGLKNGVEELKNVERNEKIEIKGLDHFTVFVVVVDDEDDDFEHNGWNTSTNGYNGSHKWARPTQTDKVATWTFNGEDGEYAILPSWVIWQTQAKNAHYQSADIEGFDVIVNQKDVANASIASTANGTWSGWKVTGVYGLEKGDSVYLAVEDGTTDGNLSADAMAFVSMKKIYVDDDWSSKIEGEDLEGGKIYGVNAFHKINDALDIVEPGGEIIIAEGSYYESNLEIKKPITLTGAGKDSTYIKPDPSKVDDKTCHPTNGTAYHGLIIKADDVTITNLTIDGDTTRGYRMGITSHYWESGNYENTIIDKVGVTNIHYRGIVLRRNGALTNGHKVLNATVTNGGCDNQGWAILGFNTNNIEIRNSYVSNWNQGIGTGNYSGIPGTANIQNNVVEDVVSQAYTLTLNGAGTVFNSNQALFSNPNNQGIGVVTYQVEANLTNNTITGAKHGVSVGYQTLTKDKLLIGSGNIITGPGKTVADSVGIVAEDFAWDNHARNFTVNGSNITNFETGVWINPQNGMTSESAINNNNIYNNNIGLKNDFSSIIDATHNWWGHLTGPSGQGNGHGDSVSANVTFQEWLCEPYQTDWKSVNGVCKLKAPEVLGFNVSSLAQHPGATPVALQCGAYTNDNTPSQVWTSINLDGVRYQRQAKPPGGSWWTDPTTYTNTHNEFGHFGQGWEGNWEVRVRAFYDTNANGQYNLGEPVSAWSNKCSITYDITAPVVTITPPSDRNYIRGTVDLIGDINELNLWRYFYMVKGVSTGINVTSRTVYADSLNDETFYAWNTTLSSDGEYLLHLAARDLAGNRDAGSEDNIIVTVDNTAPSSTFKPDISGTYHKSEIPLQGRTRDLNGVDLVNFYYRLSGDTESWTKITPSIDASGEATFDWEYDWTPPAEGVYDIYASGVDVVGNKERTAIVYSVTYDITSPEITWESGDNVVSGPVTLSASTNEIMNNVRFVWRLQGERDWSTGVNYNNKAQYYEHLFNPTEDGIYEVRVQGRDLALNWNRARPDLTIVVDRTKPTLTIETPVNDEHIAGAFQVGGNIYDETSGIQDVRVRFLNESDNTLVQTCWANVGRGNYWLDVNGMTIRGFNGENGFLPEECDVPDGEYLIRVRARDNAGNTTSRAVRRITIDNEAPVSRITSPEEDYVTNGAIEIVGYTEDTFSVAGVTLSYAEYVDGVCSETYTNFHTFTYTGENTREDWTHLWTPDEEGTYCIKAQGVDLAGNPENTSVVKGIVYDETAPVATFTISSGILNIVKEDSLSGIDTVKVKVGDSKFVDYVDGMDLKDLVNNVPGTYPVTIVVTDKAGNPYTGTGSLTIPQPPSTDEGTVVIIVPATTPAVLGATTRATQSRTPSVGATAQTQEEILAAATEDDENEGEVLGEQVELPECEEKVLLSGYVFVDKNKDGEMNDGEKGVKGIEISVYYLSPEGQKLLVEIVTTDEEGYWEAELCEGTYYAEISEDTIPEGHVLNGDAKVEISVSEENENEILFTLYTTPFWKKALPWLLGLLIVILPTIYFLGKRKRD